MYTAHLAKAEVAAANRKSGLNVFVRARDFQINLAILEEMLRDPTTTCKAEDLQVLLTKAKVVPSEFY
jgi:hypothetical protein